MALFLIERNLVDEMELDADLLAAIEDYNGGANLRWLFSFLSADRKKSYCLYEAPDGRGIVAPPGGRSRLSRRRDRRGRRCQSGHVHQRRLGERVPGCELSVGGPSPPVQKTGWGAEPDRRRHTDEHR